MRGDKPKLPFPCLMLVTGKQAGGAAGLVQAVAEAVAGAIDAVQLREKDLPDRELLDLAHALRDITAGRALLLINGRADVAIEAGADGVHLPEAAPMIERPRDGFLIGRSVHSLEAALRAEAEGADYLIAGPVYETPSHPGQAPAGIRLIRKIAVDVKLPVLAIGGITPERVEEVTAAGAQGVAVISAILGRPSPGDAVRVLREALDAVRGRVALRS